MRPLSCLSDTSVVLALDASAAINLNATGCAADVLKSLTNSVVLPEIVLAELEEGQTKGRDDAGLTKQLVKAGLIKVVPLSETGLHWFEQLVVGNAVATLNDGEAATIAYAIEAAATAVIDERKANRICAERFVKLRLAATVDLLAHSAVQKALNRVALADAVFNALVGARMRVLPHHLKWVVDLIGPERANQCSSLPRSVRSLQRMDVG